ncbi:MAG: DUF58 domain-containing protein [Candidatus Eisenbacteria bacterium]|uniref:DUF58 domain-containing protein n=1 Tax=Eiseniibacteriota bacterium TaxID=2212470 RepID=A0A7Y2H123_UNCEI|nr:DUF58 domain-containing protein [Candidatus Eisenbacteria bacterium]
MIPREILRKVRRIEIRTRHLVSDLFGGEYHSVFKGKGMEFAEVREYAPGDDIRSIDWNVTARTGHPHVKILQEERELTVFFLVDLSGSQRFGSKNRFKAELAAEVGALLSLSAVQNNDKVGLILFSNAIELYVPPGKGRRHVLRVVREILAFEGKGQGTDLTMALNHLVQVQKRKAVVFVVSDFFTENYERSLKIASKKHDVVALRLRDPRERDLPSMGVISLRALEDGREATIDSSDPRVRRAFGEEVRRRETSFQDAVRSAGVDYVDLWTHEDVTRPLSAFFKKRTQRGRR